MRVFASLLIGVLFVGGLQAQDADSAWDTASAPALSVKIGGELAASFTGYVHDFADNEKIKTTSLGDVVSGALTFSASGAKVNAFIGLNLSADSFEEYATPLFLDEAYLRAYFGPVNIEAGLRKLTWGKADSMGPLDVTNPMDYTDLREMTDIQSVKIARPMAHISWNTNGFSKLEAVFIPNFAGHRFASSGRWASGRISRMTDDIEKEINNQLSSYLPPQYVDLFENNSQILDQFSDLSFVLPDTSGLEYFQAGLRFTTTVGPADIGMQYYYGNFFQPDFTDPNVDAFMNDLMRGNANLIYAINNPFFDPTDPGNLAYLADLYLGDTSLLFSPQYNRYHQFGVDYAQVLFDFNIRAELALFLTSDTKGNDGTVRNPFIGWSLGFDRYLFWGITANVQCNETVRLLDNKVGKDPIDDCEAGTDITSTRLTMQISKKFFNDELESKVTAILDIENSDRYIIPALVWTIGDLSTEFCAGIFAGNKDGELGHYWENSFVRIGLKYSF